MPSYSIPFPNSPFTTPDGFVSREWYLFLSSIFQSVGGPSVGLGGGIAPIDVQKQFEEYPLTAPDAIEALRGVDELRNVIYQQAAKLAELVTIVDEIRNELASLSKIEQFRNRIADLEDRLG